MIEEEFDSSSISSIQLGVSLFDGSKYLVPIDKSVDKTFKDMLARTSADITVRSGEWEEYSLSQDYGKVERVFAPRSDGIFNDISDLYEIEAYDHMANLVTNSGQVDFYFVIYHDKKGRKIVGVRKAAQLKSMLGARNRLVQLIDDTMVLVEHPVFRLDIDFDGLVCSNNIYFSNFLNMEYIAKITNKVAQAAAQRIPVLAAKIDFIDFKIFEADLDKHPRTARLLVAISKRANLDKYNQDEIMLQAAAQGVKFTNIGASCLKCRTTDKHKLLEVLDDRRWISRNTTDEAVPYRASSRQRAKP
ncbi:Kiwa anti-phage protein KwaB-like domain-containing protein [Methylobacterium sp. SI9]|uniref:Kiwa anti-phage protein KwaB-like domain-containing protein n=1 Tax=Methylobacterium guangdongense TaxID=3138811 RepID=UPI00313ED777